jgi:plastocyanin
MLNGVRALGPLGLIVAGVLLAVVGSGLVFMSGPAAVHSLVLSATDVAFVPTSVAVPAHGHVSLEFRNESSEPHTLILLDPLRLSSGRVVEPGQAETLEFVAPAPGTYDFLCNVHEGMVGTLVAH